MSRKPRAPKTPPPPAPPAVAPERVQQVLAWFAEGLDEQRIVDAIREYWPEQNERALLTEAVAHLRLAAAAPWEAVRGWCVIATQEVHRRALETGDLAVALRAVRQIADFAGPRPEVEPPDAGPSPSLAPPALPPPP